MSFDNLVLGGCVGGFYKLVRYPAAPPQRRVYAGGYGESTIMRRNAEKSRLFRIMMRFSRIVSLFANAGHKPICPMR
jgi:hypothetical protein